MSNARSAAAAFLFAFFFWAFDGAGDACTGDDRGAGAGNARSTGGA